MKQKNKKRQKKSSEPKHLQPTDEMIDEFKKKKRGTKKDPPPFSEIEISVQEALQKLAPYTSIEFEFNPLFAGDPEALVASRKKVQEHVEKLAHHMVYKGAYFIMKRMYILFQNVSLLSRVVVLFLSSVGSTSQICWLDRSPSPTCG